MPYELRKVKGGWKVGKKGSSKTYSKKAMTKEKAKAQMSALYANESFEIRLNKKLKQLNESRGFLKGDKVKYWIRGPFHKPLYGTIVDYWIANNDEEMVIIKLDDGREIEVTSDHVSLDDGYRLEPEPEPEPEPDDDPWM